MNLPRIQNLGVLEGPLLVFGGPYSNLAATRALRDVAVKLAIPPQRIICTGDLVAYCAEPEETVNLIREWGVHVVLGNCEESFAERALDCGCGFEAGSPCSVLSDQWFRYADARISEGNRLWMGQLPVSLTFQLSSQRFSCVHGAVESINKFLFASTSEAEKAAELSLLSQGIDGLITGHCGIPFGQIIEGRAWLNAGVIGLPANDGTADGWYLVIDHVDHIIKCEWHRLSYPSEQTRQTMLDAGLVNGYADTLISGLWPSEDVLPVEEKKNRGKALEIEPLIF
ncbi:metallophosphoesterase family protein [Thermodesulfobacteriota bacterium]